MNNAMKVNKSRWHEGATLEELIQINPYCFTNPHSFEIVLFNNLQGAHPAPIVLSYSEAGWQTVQDPCLHRNFHGNIVQTKIALDTVIIAYQIDQNMARIKGTHC